MQSHDSVHELNGYQLLLSERIYTAYLPGEELIVQVIRNQTAAVHWTAIYVNPAKEHFFEADTTINWASKGDYQFALTKKITTRLGRPYSDCKANSLRNRKFLGNYTTHKCKFQCVLEKGRKICNTLPAFYRKYFEEHKQLRTDAEAEKCLSSVLRNRTLESECFHKCNIQPCYEETYGTTVTHTAKTGLENTLDLYFRFPSFSETRVTEYPAYTW